MEAGIRSQQLDTIFVMKKTLNPLSASSAAGILCQRLRKLLWGMALCASLCASAAAQQTSATTASIQQPSSPLTLPLTLEDCVRLAESAPNAITVARQESQIADREVTQARAGLMPQMEMQNGFIYAS